MIFPRATVKADAMRSAGVESQKRESERSESDERSARARMKPPQPQSKLEPSDASLCKISRMIRSDSWRPD